MLNALGGYAWAAVLVAGLAVGFWGGSRVEALDCAMAAQLATAARDRQIEQARAEERNKLQAKQAASTRIDAQDTQREPDIQYVDRELVKYVTKFVDRGCPVLPARVCLYNRALGIPCDVPEAPTTGR